MVQLDVLLGYLALGYCAWRVASSIAANSSKSPHQFPRTTEQLSTDVLRPYFVTSHGLALFVHKWLPRFDQKPRGVLFILHGLGEHGGRYDHVGRALAKQGIAVFAVDHQGHGRSDGERMYCGKTQHLSKDFLEFVEYVLDGPKEGGVNQGVIDAELEAHGDVDWKRLPRFAMGHSMGGVLVLQLTELSMQRGLTWNGIIVSGAPFWSVPGGGVSAVLKVLASLLPRMTLPGFEFAKLGDDGTVHTRWTRDVLMPTHGSTLQTLCSLLSEGDRFVQSDNSLAKNFPAPVYMLHGEKDTLTFPQGTTNFYTACSQKDKTLNIVPNAVHEVFNLQGREKTIADVAAWIQARLK